LNCKKNSIFIIARDPRFVWHPPTPKQPSLLPPPPPTSEQIEASNTYAYELAREKQQPVSMPLLSAEERRKFVAVSALWASVKLSPRNLPTQLEWCRQHGIDYVDIGIDIRSRFPTYFVRKATIRKLLRAGHLQHLIKRQRFDVRPHLPTLVALLKE